MSTHGRSPMVGAALVASVVGVLTACGGESPLDLRWRLVFATEADPDRAVGFDAAIRTGSCDGEAVYEEYAAVGSTFARPGELASGTYGFWSRARDARCRLYAEGCTVETLPLADGAVLDVVLEALAPEQDACPRGDRCEGGRCAASDAGTVQDAGLDAGGPPEDGGIDGGGADDGGGTCGAHEEDCAGNGECLSLLTLTDCGACDTPCAVSHGGETCATGSCEVAGCEDGWEDCDGEVSDGCEAQLGSLEHCGGCYDACALPGAVEDCVSGTCVLVACSGNNANCDDVDANGCEVNLGEASNHCGDCLTVCDAGLQCHKGVCGPPE